MKYLAYGFLFLTILAVGTTLYRTFEKAFNTQAVILPKSVTVRSGLSSMSTELFVLHEGTLVSVMEQTKGFYKIRFSKDKIGWIPASTTGII